MNRSLPTELQKQISEYSCFRTKIIIIIKRRMYITNYATFPINTLNLKAKVPLAS